MSGIADSAVIAVGGLACSVLLPWLLGTLIMCLLPWQRPRPVTLLLGHGYLVGLVATSLLIRAFSATNTALEFWPLAACLAAMSAAAAYLIARFRPATVQWRSSNAQRSQAPAWAVAVVLLLCILLGLRFYFIAQEVLLRPLFPWDAWDSWAPRAMQFFDNRALVAELDSIKRPHGLFVSIIHLWSMLAVGSHESSLVNFPWVVCLMALCLALYGHLLEQGVRPLAALLACYMLASMPFITLHTALAGYADIWLTLIFSLGLFCIVAFQRERENIWVALTLLYAVLCVQTKYAGSGLAVILIVCQLYVFINNARRRLITALLAAALMGVITYSIVNGVLAVSLEIPWFGTFIWNDSELVFGEVWRHSINAAAIADPFTGVLWIYSNWHLLAVLTAGLLAIHLAMRSWSALARPEVLAIALTFLYSYGYHALIASRSALDHTSLSRSLIYITAIAVAWVVATLPWLKEQR